MEKKRKAESISSPSIEPLSSIKKTKIMNNANLLEALSASLINSNSINKKTIVGSNTKIYQPQARPKVGSISISQQKDKKKSKIPISMNPTARIKNLPASQTLSSLLQSRVQAEAKAKKLYEDDAKARAAKEKRIQEEVIRQKSAIKAGTLNVKIGKPTATPSKLRLEAEKVPKDLDEKVAVLCVAIKSLPKFDLSAATLDFYPTIPSTTAFSQKVPQLVRSQALKKLLEMTNPAGSDRLLSDPKQIETFKYPIPGLYPAYKLWSVYTEHQLYCQAKNKREYLSNSMSIIQSFKGLKPVKIAKRINKDIGPMI